MAKNKKLFEEFPLYRRSTHKRQRTFLKTERLQMKILELKNASVSFGGVKAIEGVSFSMKHGEVLSIVGPNGAGKTTLFNLISKIYELDSGSIVFNGIELGKLAP